MRKFKIKINIAYKVYFIVLVSVALCALFIGILNYYENKSQLRENLGSGLEKIARTAVLSVDAEELKNIKTSTDPSYKNIQRYLQYVKYYNEIDTPLYILKRASKNTASLIVTTEDGFSVGAVYRLNPTLRHVLDTKESAFSPIYSDKSGTWISAYAPIKDEKGSVIGVLELNHHIEYYVERLRFALFKIIALCTFGFLIGTILGIPLLKPILKSINILSTAALEMEKGNYDYEVRLKSSDELGHLAYTFEKMRKAIRKHTEQLKEAWLNEKKTHIESVKALSEAIAIREPHMRGHIQRISKCAELVAKELGLSDKEIETIKYGCLLHDVGKIGIDINILNKPTKLTSTEREKIKEHPRLGAQIIKGVEFLEKATEVVLYHQERYDGSGYPKGLKGEEIPIAARIVAIADAYDAMTSDRPYRERFEKDTVISKMKEESGKQFDPKVVDVFLKIKDKL